MFYYVFNIGDYKSHTEHLSEMEDLVYRRLLDWYYLHESPIPLDEQLIARQIRMRSHSDCIASVLHEFFVRTDDGWINLRADKEIGYAREKSKTASKSAKMRWDKRKDANAMQTHSESNAIQDTEYKIQDTKKISKNTFLTPDGVSEIVWNDFVKHRKAKKAQITDRVIEDIKKEATKAGWTLEDALKETVVRNWQSFKSDWVNKQSAQQKRIAVDL